MSFDIQYWWNLSFFLFRIRYNTIFGYYCLLLQYCLYFSTNTCKRKNKTLLSNFMKVYIFLDLRNHFVFQQETRPRTHFPSSTSPSQILWFTIRRAATFSITISYSYFLLYICYSTFIFISLAYFETDNVTHFEWIFALLCTLLPVLIIC